ncbi:hypothetical protein ACF0H5_006314 [Mactra antiquata]
MKGEKHIDRFVVERADDTLPDNTESVVNIEGDENEEKIQNDGVPLASGMALYEDDIVNKGAMSTLLKRSPTKVSFCEPLEEEEEKTAKPERKLGTLFGVYLPTIQNIFGVLIFIRVTWIVGMAGTIEGFLIIFLCCCTTTLTSISMSAIATNGIVPAGGSYFMISRALGPEFGGAVGILFFLGFTVAGSMYVIGAIEILVTFIAPQISLFGDVTILDNALNNYRLYGTILLFLIFIICFIGVHFVAKFGPFSLFCVIISIICIYIGIFTATPENSVKVCYLGERILTLSSVSVDGVMMCTKNETGPIYNNYCGLDEFNQTVCDKYFEDNNVTLRAGMPGLASGNFFKNIPHRYTEKDNLIGKAEPGNRDRGEIVADLTSTFTVLLAIYFPSVTGIMTGSNMSGDLKDAQKSIPSGTLAAVLSTSAVCAPRLLYAIAMDNVVPFLSVFSRTRRGEPFFALLLTVGIAEAGVLVGNLDHVTPIITMTLSLIGVGLCTTLMIISSWYYALVAFGMAGGIYKYIEYKGAEKEWGDGIRGMAMSLARYSLLKVQQTPPHTKNWRPQLLLLCKLDKDLMPKYDRIAHLAAQMKAGKGLTLLSTVLEGTFQTKRAEVKIAKENLQKLIDTAGVKGFKDVVVAKDITSGLCHMVQSAGLGGLRPNTVIVGWPNDWKVDKKENMHKLFVDTMECVRAAEMALLVVKGAETFPLISEKKKGTIDVCTEINDNNVQMKKDLEKFMYQLRIQAVVDVIDMPDEDLSVDAYERTLQMEQRIEMMKARLNKSGNDISKNNHGATLESKIDSHDVQNGGVSDSADGEELNQFTFTASSLKTPHTVGEIAENVNKNIGNLYRNPSVSEPNRKNVDRMHTAVKLNSLILRESSDAQLVISNLPPLPVNSQDTEKELHCILYTNYTIELTSTSAVNYISGQKYSL